MSGVAFSSKGVVAPAPTTVWFGGCCDRLNMALPATPLNNSPIFDSLQVANLGNQMSIYNTTFGGGSNAAVGSFTTFTTAPDGSTTNAQKFVESTATTQHFVAAGFDTSGGVDFGTFTYSQYLKYSGRRVVLKMAFVNGIASNNAPGLFGAQAIFDLANGVVGVDTALFLSSGSPEYANWVVYPAEMINYGGGWYRCSIKAFMQNTLTHRAYCIAMLDNGTGSAAESTQYAGDGTSGAFLWKTNFMPSRAYSVGSIGNRIFNEDFNDPTLSNFDKTHSRAPGFTWYLSPGTPCISPVTDTPVGDITQSGSTITVAPTSSFGGQVRIASFASDTSAPQNTPRTQPLNWSQGVANGYVGWGWTAPILYEAAWGWPVDAGTSSEWVTIWSWGIAFQMGQGHPPGFANGPSVPGLMQREIDFTDLTNQLCPSIDQAEEMRPSGITIVGGGGEISGFVGSPTWSPSYNYSGNFENVFSGGNFYTSIHPSTNDMPPSGNWSTSGAPTLHTDQTQMNVFNVLILPYQQGEFGQYATFVNGSFCTARGPNIGGYGFYGYGPTASGSGARIVQAVDGCLNSINITSGTSKASITVDRISLYK